MISGIEEIKRQRTCVADERLMDCIGHPRSNDLSGVRKGIRQQPGKTYEGLDCVTILLAVIIEIIKDLETRHWAAGM